MFCKRHFNDSSSKNINDGFIILRTLKYAVVSIVRDNKQIQVKLGHLIYFVKFLIRRCLDNQCFCKHFLDKQ